MNNELIHGDDVYLTLNSGMEMSATYNKVDDEVYFTRSDVHTKILLKWVKDYKKLLSGNSKVEVQFYEESSKTSKDMYELTGCKNNKLINNPLILNPDGSTDIYFPFSLKDFIND